MKCSAVSRQKKRYHIQSSRRQRTLVRAFYVFLAWLVQKQKSLAQFLSFFINARKKFHVMMDDIHASDTLGNFFGCLELAVKCVYKASLYLFFAIVLLAQYLMIFLCLKNDELRTGLFENHGKIKRAKFLAKSKKCFWGTYYIINVC